MRTGASAAEDAVRDGQSADIAVRADADRVAARGIKARHRTAVAVFDPTAALIDHQPAEYRRIVLNCDGARFSLTNVQFERSAQ